MQPVVGTRTRSVASGSNITIMLLSCFSDGLSQETTAVILVLTSSASRDVTNLFGQFWEVAVGPSLELFDEISPPNLHLQMDPCLLLPSQLPSASSC